MKREVFEEVGIAVDHVRYYATQPWPFPSNLMIGCFAEAKTHDIAVGGNEILAARWFDLDGKASLSGGSGEVSLPRRDAIAFHLIKTWAEQA